MQFTSPLWHVSFKLCRRMVERLARLGYVSIGVVYLIAGWFTAMAGLGRGSVKADHHDAFAAIREQPFGRTMLAVIAAGLLGYALWRLVAGVTDSDARGGDAKGIGVRISSVLRGLVHAAIALEVIRMIRGHGGSGEGSDAKAKHWTAELMDKPFGVWLVGAIGLTIVAYGAYQLYRAFESKLGKRIHIDDLEPDAKRKVVAISRFGIAARGVVFFIIGGSIVIAAVRHNPSEAQGMTGALRQIAEPFGGALLVLAGIGLAAYGLFAFVNARYRSIRA
jgi:Domain of Unknown Function (DUF1206)